jgi:hypothetical protein
LFHWKYIGQKEKSAEERNASLAAKGKGFRKYIIQVQTTGKRRFNKRARNDYMNEQIDRKNFEFEILQYQNIK